MNREKKKRPKKTKRADAQRHAEVAAVREATRSTPTMPQKAGAELDRRHFLEANLAEALQEAKKLPPGTVVAICDPRDPVGRACILGGGYTEVEIRQREASMMGQPLIPTFFIGMPLKSAVEALAVTSPNTSETIERFGATGAHQIVLAVTADGTAATAVPLSGPTIGMVVVTDAKQSRPRLASAGAYYKNDHPGGLGLVFDFTENFDEGAEFEAKMAESLRAWDEGGATPADLFGQLREFGNAKTRGGLSDEFSYVAFMNINWLEQRGHLTADEFNGVQLIYVEDESDPRTTN